MLNRDLIQTLNGESPGAARLPLGDYLEALRADVAAIFGKNAFVLTAATLGIKAASSPTVKTVGACSFMAAGVVQAKSANTDMSAIAGTLATAKVALWAFYIDSAGTITTSTKTTDADTVAAALALKPAVPANKVEIGYITVANTSGSNFVGGTTALDAAGIATTYRSNPALTMQARSLVGG
ncbi:MAG: hypothetical protein RL456_3604 [Pseudomonadota bacterium]|jgi:hypothetical protein